MTHLRASDPYNWKLQFRRTAIVRNPPCCRALRAHRASDSRDPSKLGKGQVTKYALRTRCRRRPAIGSPEIDCIFCKWKRNAEA